MPGNPEQPASPAWVELEMRGLGPGMAGEYLLRLGGRRDGSPDRFAGPGWTVRILGDLVPIAGSRLVIDRVRFQIEGEAQVVHGLVERLRLMAMRAGG